MTTSETPGQSPPSKSVEPQFTTNPYVGILAVFLGAGLATLSSRLLSVGLPDLRGALGISFDDASWLPTAFNMATMFSGVFVVFVNAFWGPRRILLPAAAIFTVAEKGVFEHANRVQPIYFAYPYEKADDMTIELPPGWQVSSVPAAQDKNGKVVAYSLKVEQSPGTLRLTRKLTIDFLLIDQKYYGALRNFFQEVRNGDGVQVVLQPGEIHASN